jgi:hypothetical protein
MTESGIELRPESKKSFKMIPPDLVAVYPILLQEARTAIKPGGISLE